MIVDRQWCYWHNRMPKLRSSWCSFIVAAVLLSACSSPIAPLSSTGNVPKKTLKDCSIAGERSFVCRNYADAEVNYKEAMKLLESQSPQDESVKATLEDVRVHLALSMIRQGKAAETEPYTNAVIEYIINNRLKDEQSELLALVDELCDEHVKQGKSGQTEAERDYLKEALKLHRLSHVGSSLRGITILSNLAVGYIREKKFSEAKKYIDPLVESAPVMPNRDFTKHMIQLLKISIALEKANQKDEAKKIQKVVTELYKRDALLLVPNSDVPGYQKALLDDRLGCAYLDYGDLDNAIEYFELSIKEQKKLKWTSDADIARVYERIAIAYEQKGDFAASEKAYKTAIQLVTNKTMSEKDREAAFELIRGFTPFLKRRNRLSEAEAWKARGDTYIRHLIPE